METVHWIWRLWEKVNNKDNKANRGGRRSVKSRWKDAEKTALSLVFKWVEVRREHWGLRRWGVDVRSSITLCKDSVINPLKMSDCRWLWEYQSVGQAWGKGEGSIQDGWRDAGRGKVEGQTEGESEINWDEEDTVPFKWEGWVSVTMQKRERKKERNRKKWSRRG